MNIFKLKEKRPTRYLWTWEKKRRSHYLPDWGYRLRTSLDFPF